MKIQHVLVLSQILSNLQRSVTRELSQTEALYLTILCGTFSVNLPCAAQNWSRLPASMTSCSEEFDSVGEELSLLQNLPAPSSLPFTILWFHIRRKQRMAVVNALSQWHLETSVSPPPSPFVAAPLCRRHSLFSYSSLEAVPIPLIVSSTPHHIFSVLPYSVWTEEDRTVHGVHYTSECVFTIKYQFSVLSTLTLGFFFHTIGDPWVVIFLQLFTISLIFHSQVALSPSRSHLNSTCVPMQYLTLIHTSTSLPSCSLLRHPPGAPCSWPHLFQNKASLAVLIISLLQLYSWMGNKKVQKERWFSTIWSLTGKHSAPRSFSAHPLLCFPMSGGLNPSQLDLAQIPLLLLMTWEHESQSFRSSSQFPVRSKMCRLKVNFFYSASWPALK